MKPKNLEKKHEFKWNCPKLNSGFEAKLSRTIDFHEGDTVNDAAFKNLVKEAVALNAW